MLQVQTVEPNTLGLLTRLMGEPWLNPFFLVGGTALALQIGHRKSIDLDLFTFDSFDSRLLLENLQDTGYQPTIITNSSNTLITEITGVKVDFIRFRYPFAFPLQHIEGIRLARMEDIACMKIDAVTGRGAKKDFFDLYFLLQKFDLSTMLQWYSKMYQHSTLFHVIKSMTFFEDAEEENDPEILDKTLLWENVKEAIKLSVSSVI